MTGWLAGPVSALRALGLLAQSPRLILLGLLPALVTLGVSIIAISLALAYGDDALARLWTVPDSGLLHVLWWVAWALSLVAYAVAVLMLTPWLVMLVAFPLCEPLAARAERILANEQEPTGQGLGFITDLARAVKSSLGVLLLGLAGAVGFLLLGLLPGVGLITTPFVALVWTPLFVSFDLFDSSLERRQLGFGRKLAILRANLPTSLSLGLTAAPLISLPFLNLLGLPVAVVAGVLVVRALERDGRV